MYPTIVDFGFVGVHSFGLMLFTAFITSGIVIQSELKRRGFAPELASAIVMAAAIGGIVGAKLYSALLDGQITFQELFSTSGIVWYGGFIGGCLAAIIVIVRSSNPFLPTIDIVGPTVILGYGIGRIGCCSRATVTMDRPPTSRGHWRFLTVLSLPMSLSIRPLYTRRFCHGHFLASSGLSVVSLRVLRVSCSVRVLYC